MSTLKRYFRPGGFRQLQELLETSPAAKRDKLLKIVAAENQRLANEVEKRLLTAEKVFSWSPETLDKIFQHIPEQTWPKALFHIPQEQRVKLFQEIVRYLPHHKQRTMIDHLATLDPSPAEVEAAQILVVKKIREMQLSGDFKPETFDPLLTLQGLDRIFLG